MRDEAKPWRTGDLQYLEREINYWTTGKGYAACTAAVHAAIAHAQRHGMDHVAVLPGWAARYDGDLRAVVAAIDPAGLVADCEGADIIVMTTPATLAGFMTWCAQHVRWG